MTSARSPRELAAGPRVDPIVARIDSTAEARGMAEARGPGASAPPVWPAALRSPAIPPRVWAALALAAAAHATALAISGTAMPRLEPCDPDALCATPETERFRVAITPAPGERGERGDDRVGEALEACLSSPEPAEGRSLSVQGPDDNPDPHVGRRRAPFDELTTATIGPLRGSWASDPHAPTAPWGRDDVLGVDPVSATGEASAPHERGIIAACFGSAPAIWTPCGPDAPRPPPTLAGLGLDDLGERRAPPPDSDRLVRTPRVVLGPIAVIANVPRWAVVAEVRDVIDRARLCYERALADDAMLSGRLDVVLRVRGAGVSVTIASKGGVERVPAMQCCVDRAHQFIWTELPVGTRATGLYSITFGRP